jgi:thymidylate synthase
MCKEIEYYQDSANLEDKKEALKVISARLDNAGKKIEDEARKHKCLEKIDCVDLHYEAAIAPLSQTRKDLQAFKNLWLQAEDSSLNDEYNTLYSLTESLKNTAKLLSENHLKIWDEWSSEQKSSAQVDDFILEQQKKVHGEVELYNQYTSAKREFDTHMNSFDFDIGGLVRIQQFAKKCAELKEQMNTEDLPESVKQLFDKLNSVGHVAYVSLLTPEVMDWLQQNNKLDTLVVRQR